MSDNLYNVTDEMHEQLDAKLAHHSPEVRELAKVVSWYAASEDIPDMILIMASPLLAVVSRFVEQNYTWNGTRNLTEEDN